MPLVWVGSVVEGDSTVMFAVLGIIAALIVIPVIAAAVVLIIRRKK